jgi:uncharacterized protein YlxP (DUF503 family)
MFVSVARLTLQIPESGSLKAKRQVLRRITDRVKARFNASVAEVEDQDLWQKSKLALAVVGNERSHVNQQMDRIIHFIEEMYIAPIIEREKETLSFGDELFQDPRDFPDNGDLAIPTGQRSLAEAEGLGDWRSRHESSKPPTRSAATPTRSAATPTRSAATPTRSAATKRRQKLSLEEARAKARSLRNPRDWEKK